MFQFGLLQASPHPCVRTSKDPVLLRRAIEDFLSARREETRVGDTADPGQATLQSTDPAADS